MVTDDDVALTSFQTKLMSGAGPNLRHVIFPSFQKQSSDNFHGTLASETEILIDVNLWK